MKLNTLFIGCALCLSTSVNAGIIIGAVDATATSEFSSSFDIGNTIDQSGLFSNYNSGVDDFDTYIASSPLHSPQAADKEWFSEFGVQSATVTYDLGSAFTLEATALWVEEAWAPHLGVSFLTSLDGVNFTSIITNITLPINSGNYAASVFNFNDVDARYFQIDFGDCSVSGCSLGEIAFSTASVSVPEPASIALLGLGLAGIGFSRKKRKI